MMSMDIGNITDDGMEQLLTLVRSMLIRLTPTGTKSR